MASVRVSHCPDKFCVSARNGEKHLKLNLLIDASVRLWRGGPRFHQDPDQVGGRGFEERPPGGREGRDEGVLPRQRKQKRFDSVENGREVAEKFRAQRECTFVNIGLKT